MMNVKEMMAMSLLISAVLLIHPPTECIGHTLTLCEQVIAINCDSNYVPSGDESLCGTDDVNYPNFCKYAQARCHHIDLSIRYFGPCTTYSSDNNGTTPTTTTLSPLTTTQDIIVQVFCSNADSHICPMTLDPVCDTQYHFHRNECEYAKVKCVIPSLKLQVLENCKGATTISTISVR